MNESVFVNLSEKWISATDWGQVGPIEESQFQVMLIFLLLKNGNLSQGFDASFSL